MTREEAIADFKEEVYKFREYLEAKKINPLKPSDDEEYKEYIHFCHEIERDIERDEIAISALSTEGEYIKKEDALNAIRESSHYGRTQKIYVCHREVVDSIDDLPTYSFPDSAENKGEWKMPIQDDGMSDPIYYQVRCSKCGFDLDPQTWHQELHQYGADNFCPNCGADMRGGKDK